MVLVDKGLAELRSEGYFAIGEGNFINIKRLKREGDAIHIISDNPDKSMYPTRLVDGEGLRIIGRVIWVGREIP
jgi:phage repressor protein C with HTH and peptisase S24 domain